MKKFLFVLIVILLSACSSSEIKSTFESIRLGDLQNPLSKEKNISIEIPSDALFQTTIYKDSGTKTASAFKSEFEKYAKSVKLLSGCHDKQCVSMAKMEDSDYLVSLEILHWEERSTNWSNKADRLNIKITIYDLADEGELTTDYIHTNSFIYSPSDGRVESYLPIIASNYVASLF